MPEKDRDREAGKRSNKGRTNRSAGAHPRARPGYEYTEISGVPLPLEVATSSDVPPPVATRPPLLPFDQLAWTAFERLCLRLARTAGNVETSRLYGTAGQHQGGIDFLTRLSDGNYAVYQCRRVAAVTGRAMAGAVKDFIAGTWRARSRRFVLCYAKQAVRTELVEQIERQRDVLGSIGIEFDVWDAESLSDQLRSQHALVDDFFGRAWVEEFCGKDAAAALGSRLDARDVSDYRRQFLRFYTSLFAQQDPGIPLQPGPSGSIVPLGDRFVLPDVEFRASVTFAAPLEEAGVAEVAPLSDPTGLDAARYPRHVRSVHEAAGTMYQRMPASRWLTSGARHLIVGPPGSGKSTLSRFVALDILSDAPQDPHLAKAWGSRLPLWLPFPFWTGLLAKGPADPASLERCVEQWLDHWGEGDLIPSVKLAIHDERLLLIIDGLDEWVEEDAGRNALQMLQVFVEKHNVTAILTARPQAISRLGFQGGEWENARLAPLAPVQQRAIARAWYRIRDEVEAGERDASKEGLQYSAAASRFVGDLVRSPELSELATFPLTLSLLLLVQFQDAVLPQGRFEAYERVVELLIATHPARRRAAAQQVLPREPLDAREIRSCLGALAFHLQCHSPGGVAPEDDVRQVFARYIADVNGLGKAAADVTNLADVLLALTEDNRGVLVRQGPHDLGFLHRSVLEYLAACHLAKLDFAEQLRVVAARCFDVRWREVLIALCVLTARREDVFAIVSRIRDSLNGDLSASQELEVRGLLADIAFSSTNLSANDVASMTSQVVDDIERHPYGPFRGALLRTALDGLRSGKARGVVQSRLNGWVFSRAKWRQSWIANMARWPVDDLTIATLMRGMLDAETEVQRASAQTIGRVARGLPDVGEELAQLAHAHPLPTTRAAATEGLLDGWPEHPALDELLDAARGSEALSLRLVGILGGAMRGSVSRDDLQFLVGLVGLLVPWRRVAGGWADVPVEALVRGWSGDEDLKRLCLATARQELDRRGLDLSAVQQLLLRAFPQDDDVAAWCVEQLDHDEHPFLMVHLDGWRLLALNFEGHAAVVEALDRWAPKQSFRDSEIALAAGVGRTAELKRTLLTRLGSASFPHWPTQALLENWGMDDAEVREALREFARGGTNASKIGYLIPRILDNDEAWALLSRELKTDGCVRPDFAVLGLGVLKASPAERHGVVSRSLQLAATRGGRFGEEVRDNSILGFPEDTQVRQMGLAQLRASPSSAGAVIWAYANDPEVRKQVVPYVLPLSPSLRHMVVSHLANSEADEELTLDTLADYRSESDLAIKTEASIGFHECTARIGRDVSGAVERLGADIVAQGFDMDDQRQAGLAGLLSLRRPDVFRDAVERDGSPARVSLQSIWAPNIPLARLLAEDWDMWSEVVGTSLEDRLRGHFGGKNIWAVLCAVTPEYPSLAAHFRRAIAAEPALRQDLAVLSCLATEEGPTSELLAWCVEALDANGGPMVADHKRVVQVARLTARHFAGSTLAQQTLAQTRHPFASGGGEVTLWDKGRVMALCLGWPGDEALMRLMTEVRIHRASLDGDPATVRAVEYACGQPAEVRRRIEADLVAARGGALWEVDAAGDFLTARLRVDRDVVVMARNWLQAGVAPGVRISLCRALVAAGAVDEDFAAWMSTEIDRQFRAARPEIGFDLLAGIARPVGYALLDLEGLSSEPSAD